MSWSAIPWSCLLSILLASSSHAGEADKPPPPQQQQQQRQAMKFVDATAQSGIDFTMTSGGTPSRYILEVNGGGVALLDYDSDGDLDLFVANGATMKDPEGGPGSRLYRNAGDGTFRNVTSEVGISVTRWAMGVAVGDYDGDGDEDLYIACYGPNVLLRNDVAASGKFVDVTAKAGVADDRWGTSAAFVDYDADGALDLYVVNYLEFDATKPPPRRGRMFKGVPVMAGPAGLAPQADVLYRNLGDGRFRDVAESSGCRPERVGYGLGVRIVDVDRDRRPDIFVGNDSSENFLFHNLGEGKFKEIGVISGVASNYDGGNQATMGIAVADVDGNGLADLFTTNFSSDTNTLHLNLGKRFFDDRTSQYGLGMISRPFLSWGTGFYDFDSDGDEDLFVASGHVYPEAADHQMDSDYEQELVVFERRGARFHRARDAGAVLEHKLSARAAAFGDLDDDGDVDVVVTTLNDKLRVLRNDTPAKPVVVVELRDTAGSRHVPGAEVRLVVGKAVRTRWPSGGSYQSVDAPLAYFGLGDLPADASAVLHVAWPNGSVSVYPDVPLNRRTVAERGTRELRSIELRGRAARPPAREP